MSTLEATIDYRQLLLQQVSDLSPQQLEKIYRALVFLKEEFLATDQVADEARYYTEPWIQAEREATEAYARGGLKSYATVDEMMDAILSEAEDQ